MDNPWLSIPLSDYEGHMSLPGIGQAKMLADLFETLLRANLPESVAVIGCAGGNGFERIDAGVTTRVVGVDINPAYIKEARERYSRHFARLELHAGDIQSMQLKFKRVDMIYAALVFEYVNPSVTLAKLASLLKPAGILVALVQCDNPGRETVTASRYNRLQMLSPVLRIIPSEELRAIAEGTGFFPVSSRRIELPSGKAFQLLIFRLPTGHPSDRG